MSTQSNPERTSLEGQDLALDVDNPEEYHVLVEFPEAPQVEPPPEATPRGVARGGVSAHQIEQRSRQAIQAAMKTIREMALQTDLMRKGGYSRRVAAAYGQDQVRRQSGL